MARTFDGSSGRIERGGTPPVTAVPVTLAAWFKTTTLSVSQVIVSIGNADGSRLAITITSAGNPRAGSVTASGTTSGPQQTGGLSTGTWFHIVGAFTSSTSRTLYVDGAFVGTDTTSSTISTFDRMAIGSRWEPSAWGTFFNGQIAEPAMWSDALTAAEAAALAKGFSPALVRPQSLVFYAPLVRDLMDLKGGALSATGTSASDHLRVIY
ncbi:LamG-like jellyroll fold domain-containing protein [Verrucomicrobium spinosum]|uniref:LamG-like jellyroll fold domain-containing protein n=1 Tax=Verrucomicrobium spinosum TaxID=2736 RepID=UPI00017449D6|nr:LamG-like jellyroll fold domain-containing protein [Verrucomicrobium spinosum]